MEAQKKERQRGFTLMELMVVIVIMGFWPAWWCLT